MTCPELTGNRCQCPACGLPFTSPRECERHRTGCYAAQGEWQGTRRCLTAAELTARGWRTNARGFWMQGRKERAGRPATVQPHRTATHAPPGDRAHRYAPTGARSWPIGRAGTAR